MGNNKKVLIITYYFPPINAIASRRPYGLAKYLKQYGWEPVILTVKMQRENHNEFNIIEVDYPGNVLDLFNFAFNTSISPENFWWQLIEYPHRYKNLTKRMVKKADEYLKNNKVEAILTSSGPEVVHIAGKKIKEKHDIPWHADMRDLWTQNYYYKQNCLRKLFDTNLEKNLLPKANAVTTVSDPLAGIQSNFLDGKTIDVIHNGFDPAEVFVEEQKQYDKLTFIHTGLIYENYQTPEHLFKAVSELIQTKLIDENKISINFFGAINQNIVKLAQTYGLENLFAFSGKIPRQEVLIEQKKSHILLYFQWENSEHKGIYSGKIFEYLAAKRPILVTGGKKDVVGELLDNTCAGVHALTNEEIKQTILKYYNEFIHTGKVSYNAVEEEVNKYSYPAMAGKFADILDRITR